MSWWDNLKKAFGPSETMHFVNRPDLSQESFQEPIRPPIEQPGMDLGQMDISMYNPDPNQTDADPWIAPRNFDLRPGSDKGVGYVAVPRRGENDPTPMYPYGSTIEIDGKQYQVRDLMGAYADGQPQWNTNRVDIFNPDETPEGVQRSRQFGRKKLPVRFYDQGIDPNPLN
jgi:hypothetical protein